jgi:hypothetical protein
VFGYGEAGFRRLITSLTDVILRLGTPSGGRCGGRAATIESMPTTTPASLRTRPAGVLTLVAAAARAL